MAHTDRDDNRWFWQDHFRPSSGRCTDSHHQRGLGGTCWCNRRPSHWKWAHPYRYDFCVPSVWKRQQRKAERANARNQMDHARTGHTDWDDLAIAYRRPYFW